MAKSTQAQAAAMIRKELKKHGIKATVRSESASMMTAVRVTVYNQANCAENKIKEYLAQFEYGSFNAMEDIYEMDNSRDDIPQVKYVTFTNEISPEIRERAWQIIKADYDLSDDERHLWDTQQKIYRELSDDKSATWAEFKPRQRVMAA